MEKRKLLFVAISVGIFLVFTIGAAILIFLPKDAPAAIAGPPTGAGISVPPPQPHTIPAPAWEAPAHTGISQPVDAVDMVRRDADVPGLRPLPEGAGVPDQNFLVQGQPQRPQETVISVPRPTTTAVPITPPAANAAPRVTQPAQQRPPAQAAPAPRVTTPAAPAAQTRPAAAAPAAPAVTQARPAAQARGQHDYWVQTGAFSTVSNAEGVKEALASKGIASIIDNRIIEGRPLFRVRVGPYTSISEANYWLSLIRSIDGFEDSQVRQTMR